MSDHSIDDALKIEALLIIQNFVEMYDPIGIHSIKEIEEIIKLDCLDMSNVTFLKLY